MSQAAPIRAPITIAALQSIEARQPMAKLEKSDALDIATRFRIPLNRDFHALDSTIVESIIAAADSVKYRRPANANGSRARYFHAYLCRVASRRD